MVYPYLFAGEYVASGSDDGRWFIWEKRTGRLIKMLQGDEAGKVTTLSLSSRRQKVPLANLFLIFVSSAEDIFIFFCSCELCTMPSI